MKRGLHGDKERRRALGFGLFSNSAQAYTEYLVILAVLLGVGLASTSAMASFDILDEIFIDYYRSLANYLNLPFF